MKIAEALGNFSLTLCDRGMCNLYTTPLILSSRVKKQESGIFQNISEYNRGGFGM